MGGGGAADAGRVPNRHPTTPTCAVTNATAGIANTGGGGGSGKGAGTSQAGGSGVVFLKILTSQYTGTTTGSPSVSTVGSYTILQYNGSGSYTA